jgi:hydroxymethylpyrimidine/phosphomethylpyrimidine kinase
VLTIAATDCSGAAGLSADLATLALCGVHATSAITAVTAQTSTHFGSVVPIRPEMIVEQIESARAETPPDAVKTGLLHRADAVGATLDALADLGAPLVVDPVLVDGTGRRIVDNETLAAYRDQLIPRATVLTPNRWEAELLTGRTLPDPGSVGDAAADLLALGAEAVVVTGGRLGDQVAVDVLVRTGRIDRYEHPRLITRNVRGSGCVFSAALAARLAAGRPLPAAVADASRFAHDAVRRAAGWSGWAGRGPVAHLDGDEMGMDRQPG